MIRTCTRAPWSIDAVHPTALQGIDDLVFAVTRAVSLDSDLDVPVTLSSGIIDADRLSHTVTIGANQTSAELRVHTRALDPAAATGDVVATVDDGEQYDVPDPPTASVRVYVGETLVTVRPEAGFLHGRRGRRHDRRADPAGRKD